VETYHRYKFVPEKHKQELIGIINDLNTLEEYNEKKLGQVLKKYPKNGNQTYSKSEIIQGFRAFSEEFSWNEAHFFDRLRMKPIRTASGVAPVTVLTKPYPCPGQCIFCPNDVRMPKSYLSMEPGAQRATQNAFDPYAQTMSRLKAFHFNGHRLNKIELIILGGTWSSYPRSYQIWFVKRCFDAMNDFTGKEAFGRPDVELDMDFLDLDDTFHGDKIEKSYNKIVSGYLKEKLDGKLFHQIENASYESLEAAHQKNIMSKHRCVGLVVETRPDEISEAELVHIRKLGGTKIQIGIQSLNDKILQLNKRGHTVKRTRKAIALIREAGFKIHAHWMPNLYGATVNSDIEEFEHMFGDQDFRPDELKVYPCSLIESAELMTKYREGSWLPYTFEDLVDIMENVLPQVPEYCRVTRVIRDIPSHDIVVGNKLSNFRELATKRLKAQENSLRDIRSREIRTDKVHADDLTCDEIVYETSIGEEHFLQFVTTENRIVGFLRLSLPKKPVFLEEISNHAMIRELHVYGPVVQFGSTGDNKPQHVGLGTKLIERSVEIARDAGFKKLSVISAIGTKGYYSKQGFEDGPLYMHRSL